ncbi:fluoride efflux transporter FluC [Weissella koreensis]|uniref:Fluoride-specific ion channel n=1 Tax=Weissella koreensis TaxID=165096 RepID=A0A7H1MKU3_9LACO|nr:CrcB family protein [Weissella koreensis]AVH74877.1 hypothetical protein C4597_02060 [Weissella koreensis]EJF33837.1 hypothetical protein JC2156_06510 [Weissella koreensis KCTC 3621]QGN20100.1 hypothetical protein GKC51_02035 [Weissella koreensis]QNT64079.1 hypothetical protein FY536_01760 [Weissella koreensis]
MILKILIVGMGAAIGSMLRFYMLDRLTKVSNLSNSWMVVIINLLAAFGMGYLSGLSLSYPWHTLVTSGIMGGFSTFSTPMNELAQSLNQDNRKQIDLVLLKTGIMFILGLPILILGMYLA